MFEEDHPLPGFWTASERYTFWQLSIMGVFASWAFGGTIFWASPYLITLGLTALIIFMMHGSFGHHPDGKTYFYYLGTQLPFFYFIVITLLGLGFYPLAEVELEGGRIYYHLETVFSALPTTLDYAACWVPLLFKGVVLMSVLNLIFVAESHYMLRRLLMVLCINAIVLAVLGYIGFFIDAQKIWGIITPPSASFFASFAHPDHWGAFALLWSVVLLGVIAHLRRRHSWLVVLEQQGVWLLVGIVILTSTLFVVPSMLYQWLFCLALFVALIDSMIFRLKYRRNSSSACLVGIVEGLIGTAALGYVSVRFFDFWSRAVASNDSLIGATLGIDMRQSLYADSWAAFLDRPIWGWGEGSFARVMAYYENTDIGGYFFDAAYSVVLQTLVENGVVGFAVWLIVLAVLLVKFARLKIKRMFSYYLLGACLLGGISGLVDNSFLNPAFVVSFAIILFTAIRWSQTASQPTPVFAKSESVFSEAEMKRAMKRAKPKSSPPKAN